MVKATNQNGFESRWCHILDEASYYNKRQSKGSQMEHTNEKVWRTLFVLWQGMAESLWVQTATLEVVAIIILHICCLAVMRMNDGYFVENCN